MYRRISATCWYKALAAVEDANDALTDVLKDRINFNKLVSNERIVPDLKIVLT